MKKAINDMQNTVANLDSKDHDWRTFSFAFPKRKIRLGTSFSGIGAIEHAFKRLGLTTEIVFAGDIDENCKKLILPIMIFRMISGIKIFMNWMQLLTTDK